MLNIVLKHKVIFFVLVLILIYAFGNFEIDTTKFNNDIKEIYMFTNKGDTYIINITTNDTTLLVN